MFYYGEPLKTGLKRENVNTNDVLLAIPGWATVHPLLKIIPVEWNYSIPYGILHSPEPTPTVQRFLDAAKIISKELYN